MTLRLHNYFLFSLFSHCTLPEGTVHTLNYQVHSCTHSYIPSTHVPTWHEFCSYLELPFCRKSKYSLNTVDFQYYLVADQILLFLSVFHLPHYSNIILYYAIQTKIRNVKAASLFVVPCLVSMWAILAIFHRTWYCLSLHFLYVARKNKLDLRIDLDVRQTSQWNHWYSC